MKPHWGVKDLCSVARCAELHKKHCIRSPSRLFYSALLPEMESLVQCRILVFPTYCCTLHTELHCVCVCCSCILVHWSALVLLQNVTDFATFTLHGNRRFSLFKLFTGLYCSTVTHCAVRMLLTHFGAQSFSYHMLLYSILRYTALCVTAFVADAFWCLLGTAQSDGICRMNHVGRSSAYFQTSFHGYIYIHDFIQAFGTTSFPVSEIYPLGL